MPRSVTILNIAVSCDTATTHRVIRVSLYPWAARLYVEGENKEWVRTAYAVVATMLRQHRVRWWPLRNPIVLATLLLVALGLMFAGFGTPHLKGHIRLTSPSVILAAIAWGSTALLTGIAWSLPAPLRLRPLQWRGWLIHIGTSAFILIILVLLYVANKTSSTQVPTALTNIAIVVAIGAGVLPLFLADRNA